MFNPKQLELLQAMEGVDLLIDTDLSKFSTMRLMSQGYIAIVQSKDALRDLLIFLHQEKLPYQAIGWGANTILPQKMKQLLIKLDFSWSKEMLSEFKESYRLPASFPLNQLTSAARRFNFKGWEVFTGIPASLGGAVFMNAGTSLGEIGSLVKKVWVIDPKGNEKEYVMNEKSFSYRKNHFLKDGEIIVEIELSHFGEDKEVSTTIVNYLKMRTETQPLNEKTCGCMFKNTQGQIPTGKGIDELGLKGKRIGNLRVSPIHGNFMENLGGASEEDVKNLVQYIQEEFEKHYGFKPQLEVKID